MSTRSSFQVTVHVIKVAYLSLLASPAVASNLRTHLSQSPAGQFVDITLVTHSEHDFLWRGSADINFLLALTRFAPYLSNSTTDLSSQVFCSLSHTLSPAFPCSASFGHCCHGHGVKQATLVGNHISWQIRRTLRDSRSLQAALLITITRDAPVRPRLFSFISFSESLPCFRRYRLFFPLVDLNLEINIEGPFKMPKLPLKITFILPGMHREGKCTTPH